MSKMRLNISVLLLSWVCLGVLTCTPAMAAQIAGATADAANSQGAFVPGNLVDGDLATAWVGGGKGVGPGKWIELTFPAPVKLEALGIATGHQGKNRFGKFRRLTRGVVIYPDETRQKFTLKPTPGMQRIALQPKVAGSIKIIITGVEPGTGDASMGKAKVAVSEIRVFGEMDAAAVIATPDGGVDAVVEESPAVKEPEKSAEKSAEKAAGKKPKKATKKKAAPEVEVKPDPAAKADSVVKADLKPLKKQPSSTKPKAKVSPVKKTSSAKEPVAKVVDQPAVKKVAPEKITAKKAAPKKKVAQKTASKKKISKNKNSARRPANQGGSTITRLRPVAEISPEKPLDVGAISPWLDLELVAEIKRYFGLLTTLHDSYPELFVSAIRERERAVFLKLQESMRAKKEFGGHHIAMLEHIGLNFDKPELKGDRALVRVHGPYRYYIDNRAYEFWVDTMVSLIREQGKWLIEDVRDK